MGFQKVSIWDRLLNCWWDRYLKKLNYGGQNWRRWAKLEPKTKIGRQYWSQWAKWSAKLGQAGTTATKPIICRSYLAKCGVLRLVFFRSFLHFWSGKSRPQHRKLIVYGLFLYVNAKGPRIRTTSGGQKSTFRRGSQCRTKTCLKIGSNNISILRFLNTQVVISRGKVEVFRAGSNTIAV